MVKELHTRKGKARQRSNESSTSTSTSSLPRNRRCVAILFVAFSAAVTVFQVLKFQFKNGGMFNTSRFISIVARNAYSSGSGNEQRRDPWVESLPLNPNGTLAEDVLSIQHDVYNSKLSVALRWNARCQQPFLIGRLSGPALVKVDNWTFHVHRQQDNATASANTTTMYTTMEGTYRAPVGGQYFLEIVGLYCQDLFYNLKHEEGLLFQERTQTVTGMENTTAHTTQRKPVNWLNSTKALSIMQYNFKPLCMENPFHHRLTANDAMIWVDPDTVTNQREATKHIVGGFWYFQPPKKPNTTAFLSSANSSSNNGTATAVETWAQKPLHTRHQPYECREWRKPSISGLPKCRETGSRERYKDYRFKWNDHPMSNQRHHGRGPPLMRMKSLVLPKPSAICFIGASHSRAFLEASGRLKINQLNNNLTIHWAEIQFPTQIRADLVQAFVQQKKCDKVVIAVGQWPASYMSTNPLVFTFYAQMKVALESLVKHNVTQQVDVYARNIHHNPLKHAVTSCPPTGWRHPMVIDGYNAAIQQLCRELSSDITYLDTQFLTDAVWDGSPDWCHLHPEVAEEELLYVAASVFGLLPPSNDGDGVPEIMV